MGAANSLYLPSVPDCDRSAASAPLSFNLLAAADRRRRNSFPSSVSSAAIKNAAGDRPNRTGRRSNRGKIFMRVATLPRRKERVQRAACPPPTRTYSPIFEETEKLDPSMRGGGGGGDALNVARLPQHDLQARFRVDSMYLQMI